MRSKRDFPGLRSLTFLKIRLAEENDKEFVEEIEETKSVTTTKEEKPVNTDKDDLAEFIKSFAGVLDSTNFKIYRVVFTPGRKPRKRDLSDGMLIPAQSKQAALNVVKGELSTKGITDLKDKYFNVVSLSTQEVLNCKEFKSFLANRKDIDSKLLKIDDSKPDVSDSKIKISEIAQLNKFKNITVTMKRNVY